MRGLPLTTALTSTYFIAFLIPELFRFITESSNDVNLPQIRIVVYNKERFLKLERAMLYVSDALSLSVCHSWTVFMLAECRSHGLVLAWLCLTILSFAACVALALALLACRVLPSYHRVRSTCEYCFEATWARPMWEYGAIWEYGLDMIMFHMILVPFFLAAWLGYSKFPTPFLASKPQYLMRLFEYLLTPSVFISAGYGQVLGLYSLLYALISRSSPRDILFTRSGLEVFFMGCLPVYCVFHTFCAFFYFYNSK